MDTAASNSDIISQESSARDRLPVSSHFWFCTYPSFTTRLFFTGLSAEVLATPSIIEVFDCDGAQVNSAEVSFTNVNVGVLDLEPFVAGCKLESGLRQGHVLVRSAADVRHQCRVESRKSGTLFSAQREVQKRRDQFIPICFMPDKTNYLALVNHSAEESQIRTRVFCGSRTPKTDLFIPAQGTRIFQVESLFPEYAYLEDRQVKAYVRLTLLAGGTVGCMAFDRQLLQSDQDLFRAVS